MPYDVSGESGCEGCQCIKSGCTGIISLVDVNGCVRPSMLPKEILRVKYHCAHLAKHYSALEYGARLQNISAILAWRRAHKYLDSVRNHHAIPRIERMKTNSR